MSHSAAAEPATAWAPMDERTGERRPQLLISTIEEHTNRSCLSSPLRAPSDVLPPPVSLPERLEDDLELSPEASPTRLVTADGDRIPMPYAAPRSHENASSPAVHTALRDVAPDAVPVPAPAPAADHSARKCAILAHQDLGTDAFWTGYSAWGAEHAAGGNAAGVVPSFQPTTEALAAAPAAEACAQAPLAAGCPASLPHGPPRAPSARVRHAREDTRESQGARVESVAQPPSPKKRRVSAAAYYAPAPRIGRRFQAIVPPFQADAPASTEEPWVEREEGTEFDEDERVGTLLYSPEEGACVKPDALRMHLAGRAVPLGAEAAVAFATALAAGAARCEEEEEDIDLCLVTSEVRARFGVAVQPAVIMQHYYSEFWRQALDSRATCEVLAARGHSGDVRVAYRLPAPGDLAQRRRALRAWDPCADEPGADEPGDKSGWNGRAPGAVCEPAESAWALVLLADSAHCPAAMLHQPLPAPSPDSARSAIATVNVSRLAPPTGVSACTYTVHVYRDGRSVARAAQGVTVHRPADDAPVAMPAGTSADARGIWPQQQLCRTPAPAFDSLFRAALTANARRSELGLALQPGERSEQTKALPKAVKLVVPAPVRIRVARLHSSTRPVRPSAVR